MAKRFTDTIVTLIVNGYRLHPCPLLIPQCITLRFGLLNLRTVQAIRKYCSNGSPKNNELNKEKIDNELTNLYKMDLSLITAVSNILSIDVKQACQICHNIDEVEKLTKDEILNIINIAKKAGISISSITNNIPLFVKNMEQLEDKLECIKYLNENINDVLPLLNIDLRYLNVLATYEAMDDNNKNNKIRYLANKLKCNINLLCELIVKEPIILTLSINRIKAVIKILEEFNYESKDILDNLWLFKYSPKTIHNRSLSLRLAGLQKVKSWVIRCSVDGLQRYMNTLRKESLINNVYGSHVSLLSKKLNISKKDAEFYIKRCPSILEIQLDKIDEVLDIVLKYGYSAEDILPCQRIFLLRTKLLEERLEKLHQLRGQHRLTLVYCSAKVFEDTMKAANKIYNKDEESETDNMTQNM